MLVERNILIDLNLDIFELIQSTLDYVWNENDRGATYILKSSFNNQKLLVNFLRLRFEVKVDLIDGALQLMFGLEMFYDESTVKKLLNLYQKFKRRSSIKTTNVKLQKLYKIETIEIENEIKQYINDIYCYWKHLYSLRERLRDFGINKLYNSLVQYLNEIPENYNNPDKTIWGIKSGYKCFYCMSNDHYLNDAWKCDRTEKYCVCECWDGNCHHDPTIGYRAKKLYFQIDGFENYFGDVIRIHDWMLKEFVIKKKIVLYELEDYLKAIIDYKEVKSSFEKNI